LKKNNQKIPIIIGHAIISGNCCIADDKGNMPESLISEKDWELFQEDLDQSDIIILGRRSYEYFHNKRRNRLIPTTQIQGYHFQDKDLCFFNPSFISLEEAISLFTPHPKKIAVVGGQKVYELVFEQLFYHQFHLSIKMDQFLINGQPFIRGITKIVDVRKYIEEKGMQLKTEKKLDSDTTQYVYSRF
jgi:dihydrofolate reductase